MNSRQAQQYARGLEMAQRDSLTVCAHGVRRSDGAPIYCVPSRTAPGTWHVIVVNGLDLQCDCAAAQHGKYCCHRSAVRARLILEAQVRQDTREREVERAFHAAARALNVKLEAAPALGRSPKPRDDTWVFSRDYSGRPTIERAPGVSAG
jgi:hypothetical protein